MIAPLPAMGLVALTMGGMLVLLKLIERWLRPPAELTRKLMHVGMGLSVLSFPWLFDKQWPVQLLAGLATTFLLAIHFVPRLRDGVGTVLNRVERPSLGEVYFPIAVGVLFYISERDKLLYCVPMLIMTLADTVAALIGIAYGRVRYVTSEGLKSAEGSIAFFAIAFLSMHIPLLLFTDVGRAETLMIALIIGILAMLLEAIAWRGLDNLLIPLGALAFLKLYMDKPADELGVRLIATTVLLVFALSWRRRSTLDDSALVEAALFGYAAWMLGGPLWLIGPLLLFLAHVIAWPREGEQRTHSVFAVLSIVSTALFWLALHVRDDKPVYFGAYAITFGAQLAIFGVSRIALSTPRAKAMQTLGGWIVCGTALAILQMIVYATRTGLAITPAPLVAALAGVCAGASLFFLARPMLYQVERSRGVIHLTGFVCGLAASGLAVGLVALVRRAT